MKWVKRYTQDGESREYVRSRVRCGEAPLLPALWGDYRPGQAFGAPFLVN